MVIRIFLQGSRRCKRYGIPLISCPNPTRKTQLFGKGTSRENSVSPLLGSTYARKKLGHPLLTLFGSLGMFLVMLKTSRMLTGEALHQLRTLLLQHTKPIPEWAMNEWNLQGDELSSSAVPVHLAHPYSGQEVSAQHDVPAQPVFQVRPTHPTTGQGDSSQPRGEVQAQIARSMLSWAEMAVSFRSARAQPISLAE
ncbi:hypothetical protein OIU74_013911 [Salix koriyanagi]|uniref:Uncharacterized protein n=1 Tax=Salix koriyanagi TaxID=2511006 RepID=A0A9Q0PUR5_9ROSI|nr:hypothetical protein OIU74_013911 [Salix koriyanagi]